MLNEAAASAAGSISRSTRPDRRNRHREAIDDRRRSVAHRKEPPGRASGREHAAAKRVDGDQHTRGLEHGVDDAPHARVGEVEGVERARQHAKAGERQRREQHEHPGCGERAAQPARRARGSVPVHKAAREPAERRRGQRERDHDRRHGDLAASAGRSPTAPNQLPISPRITSASTGASRQTAAQSCGLRTLDERAKVRCANNWRRAALMRVLRSSASSSMARAARRLASSLSCLCFSFSSSLAATSVVGAASPDLGVSSVEALRRGRKAGRQGGDRPLQRQRERVGLRAQALQIGVIEIAAPDRGFSRGQRRARLIEIEPMGFLRAGAPEAHQDEDQNGPVQQAQCGRRLHRKVRRPPGDSAALPPFVIRPWPGRGGNRGGGAGRRSPWGKVRGCARAAALLKGARRPMRAIP